MTTPDTFYAWLTPRHLIAEREAAGWRDEGPLPLHHGAYSNLMTKDETRAAGLLADSLASCRLSGSASPAGLPHHHPRPRRATSGDVT